MGPMVKGRPLDRKRIAKVGALLVVALFVWSFIAAPPAQTADEIEIEEPTGIEAYDTHADATPVAPFIDHRSIQTVPVALNPAIAHSNSEVSYPSAASSIAWLLDGGLVNSVHGTTTGNKVPTEVTASQPGGTEEQEFFLARDTAGNNDTARYGAGVARATAESSDRPRGYAHSYLGNLVLLPAPGSPEQPPGTYDPAGDDIAEQENPTTFIPPSGSPTPSDDPRAFTPNPRQQMGVFTIGSIASTTETLREEGRVISIAVAELNGINLGNRTGDNRCTNCFTIDSLRVEARAETDAQGTSAWWRILIHRACRVATANDGAGNAYEAVTCLDPDPDKIIEVMGGGSGAPSNDPDQYEHAFDPRDPNGRGVRRIASLEKLNEMFQKGLGAGDFQTGDLMFRMYFGKNAAASKPKDSKEEAWAYARGLEIQVTSVPTSAGLAYLEKQVGMPAQPVLGPIQQNCEERATISSQLTLPCPNGVLATAKDLRTVSLTLGRVSANATARAGLGNGGGLDDGSGTGAPGFPSFDIPSFDIPSFDIPSGGSGGGNTYVVGGLPAGKMQMKINWSSMRIKPWKPADMAKGLFAAALAAGLVLIIRRRLRAAAGGA